MLINLSTVVPMIEVDSKLVYDVRYVKEVLAWGNTRFKVVSIRNHASSVTCVMFGVIDTTKVIETLFDANDDTSKKGHVILP